MIETEAQQLVVRAVKDGGGQALKFNNRFMIGVCDLFIKLPTCQPMLLEAKLHNLSPRTLEAGFHIADIGCTKLQKDFLRDWGDAGMLTGVVSFLQENNKGVASLRMALYSRGEMLKRRWSADIDDHVMLGGPSERFFNIRQQLIEFANG